VAVNFGLNLTEIRLYTNLIGAEIKAFKDNKIKINPVIKNVFISGN